MAPTGGGILMVDGLGPPRPVAANSRLVLDDPSVLWMVTAGEVRVFAVELVDGKPDGPMHPLSRVHPGDVMVGSAQHDDRFVLCAVGIAPGSEARPLPVEALRRQAGNPEVVASVERLMTRLAGAVAPVDDKPDQATVEASASLAVGEEAHLLAGGQAFARHEHVWVPAGTLTLWGQRLAGTAPAPPGVVFGCDDDAVVVPTDAATALATEAGWEGVRSYVRAALAMLGQVVERHRAEDAARLERLVAYDTDLRGVTYTNLGSVLTDGSSTVVQARAGDELLVACRLVAEAADFELVDPPQATLNASDDPVAVVASWSRVRTRTVVLNRGWWHDDSGPLLGRYEESGGWVALLPRGTGHYDLVDPARGERRAVDDAVSATLQFEATQFYRPLPHDVVTGRNVLSYVLDEVRRDGRRMLLTGVAVGLLSLLPTLVAEVLFNTVVPSGDRHRLVWLISLLLVATLATGAFSLAQALASLRVETKGAYGLQAAIFDRLLDLPTPFFRRFISADLAVRAMGVENLREVLSQYTVTTVLALFAALFNVVLLFVIQPVLAVYGLMAVVLGIAGMVVAFRSLVRRQQIAQDAMGDVFGLGVQILAAVPKLRIAHAERRAFANWANRFAELKRASTKVMRAAALQTSFFAAFTPLATALVFVGAAAVGPSALSAGSFLAFNTSFTAVVGAISAMSVSVAILASAVPFYRRLRPILDELPETSEVRADPGPLRGAIDVSHVSFRYTDDGPPVLDDVSFTVAPGELVAIVGPSGSGKSSLLRLLLGFEHPNVGTVSYDEKDLSGIDVRAVRRQCGVVIQGSRLSPDDIFHNIVGTRKLTMDDAWAAARLAGIEDYIRTLPMGMHTVVNEYGGAFSGGQRQLLLLARALVGTPRVVYLDEATSALDNRSQAVVMHNLEAMRATRLIIAHRLSTIRNADRILVLVGGNLVQTGTYDELMAVPGPFADLVNRQTL